MRDKSNRHGVWVFPTPEDGPANFFSTKDAAARRYNAQEDTGWQFGATGHLGFDNGESVAEQDVIFWYVSHLYHDAADGPDQWHFVGPTLKVSR